MASVVDADARTLHDRKTFRISVVRDMEIVAQEIVTIETAVAPYWLAVFDQTLISQDARL